MTIHYNILRKILWSQYNKTIANIKATTPIDKQNSYISICTSVARFTDVILTLIPII